MNALFTYVRRIYRFYAVLTPNQRLWVKALRSGEYKQTRGYLWNKDGHCCLGVGARLYEKKTDVRFHSDRLGRSISNTGIFAGHICGTLKDDFSLVVPFLGLKTEIGQYKGSCLSQENDAGADFNQIANIIVNNAESLFVGK